MTDTSAAGQFSQQITLDVSPGTIIASDDNSRTLRLTAVKAGDNTGVWGGYAYVEYI